MTNALTSPSAGEPMSSVRPIRPLAEAPKSPYSNFRFAFDIMKMGAGMESMQNAPGDEEAILPLPPQDFTPFRPTDDIVPIHDGRTAQDVTGGASVPVPGTVALFGVAALANARRKRALVRAD